MAEWLVAWWYQAILMPRGINLRAISQEMMKQCLPDRSFNKINFRLQPNLPWANEFKK